MQKLPFLNCKLVLLFKFRQKSSQSALRQSRKISTEKHEFDLKPETKGTKIISEKEGQHSCKERIISKDAEDKY